MPSSTSNSNPTPEHGLEHGFAERDVPSKPWIGLLAAVVVIVASGLAWWEAKVRSMGYGPTYNDTPNFWAESRARAEGATREQIVFVGASRTLFDIDLEIFRDATGGPLPIQLATVGSNPKIILADLAADPSYAGTTIVGIVSGLLAAGGGPPLAMPARYVSHYHRRSLADVTELPMALWLQERLAMLNAADLSIGAMLEHGLDLPPREGVYAPRIPGYLASLDRNRRAWMFDRIVDDPQARHDAQQIWIPLFSPVPKPSVFSDEEWAKINADGLTANIDSVKDSVDKITARGGRVIFMLLPSTEKVLELERQYTPRAMVWDRLLRETGAPGIHFEDYAELQGFECPEWSHLSGPDSVEFSRRLVRVMQQQGLLPAA